MEQIKRLQNAVESRRQFLARRNFKWDLQFANALSRANELLGDGRFSFQERFGDFSGAESAKCAERQGGLGLGGKFGVDFVTKTMVFAILALSLELLVGQVGLICFGQAAFFGIGAYAVVLLTPKASVSSKTSPGGTAPALVIQRTGELLKDPE